MSVSPLPGWLTIPQAAAATGLSDWTIRKEIKLGNLRARTIGRIVRILEEDLAAWMRGERSTDSMKAVGE